MTALAELMIPWDRGDVLASVHREGQVLSERAEEHGMRSRLGSSRRHSDTCRSTC